MKRIFIDARDMPYPVPLERGIAALQTINSKEYIHMINRRNPIPLITLAQRQGFNVYTHKTDDDEWHILISKQEKSVLKELIDV